MRRAYVLGINYTGENASDDEGCWKHTADYAEALSGSRFFEQHEVFKYCNIRTDGAHYTSKTGMQKLLCKIADRSQRESVDLVYVHFCGRGTKDGIETCDGHIVSAEWLIRWAASFPAATRVVATFDCGFSCRLPTLPGRSAMFAFGESITHALIDILESHPEAMSDVSAVCKHVWSYVGELPKLTSMNVKAGGAFLPARVA